MHNGFCQQWSIVFVKLFLGKKLKQLRGNKSQVNAAKIMEVSQQCWQAWESNTNELSATTIHGICTKFNCSADWLLGLNEKPQPQPSLPDTPKLCIECTKKDETIANLSKTLAQITAQNPQQIEPPKKATVTPKPLSTRETATINHN